MPKRDIVVVGASAGGLDPMRRLVSGLPPDFPAAVFIVWHISPQSPNMLPHLLNHTGALFVESARDDEAIRPGRVYVAPPDRHLLLSPGRVRVTYGPKENRFRPAVDALFRSAAYSYGHRVIGVVLSGLLDDGTAGLWTIKDRGGLAIIQDLAEAEFPSMPSTAKQYVDIDYELPVAAIASTLVQLCSEEISVSEVAPVSKELEAETRIAQNDYALETGLLDLGVLTPYGCPECHGTLLQLKDGGVPRFRCHTGHAYSIHSLLAEMTEGIEQELWSTARAVEESALLMRQLAKHLREAHDSQSAVELEQKADEAEQRLGLIRQALKRHEKLSAEKLQAEPAAAPAKQPRRAKSAPGRTNAARKRTRKPPAARG